jgi:hypothetical protein
MERSLYDDMLAAEWFQAKVKGSKAYSQNLYAAMCNMQWQVNDVIPILKDEFWSCTWRASGGIVAEFRKEGDYMDWYCSGMGGVAVFEDDNEEELGLDMVKRGYVGEGVVTEEIRNDLFQLGWSPVPYDDDGV